jgi:hypothetical protein
VIPDTGPGETAAIAQALAEVLSDTGEGEARSDNESSVGPVWRHRLNADYLLVHHVIAEQRVALHLEVVIADVARYEK